MSFERAFWDQEELCSDNWAQYLPVYRAELDWTLSQGRPVRLLVIGVQNGELLQRWAKVLPTGSEIAGIDVDPQCASLQIGDLVRVVIGDANNHATIERLFTNELFDIIIADGSHVSCDAIVAFLNCFPHLAPGGTYLIEKLRAAYCDSNAGVLCRPSAPTEFLKSLTDSLDADYFEGKGLATDSEASELAVLGAWIDRISLHGSIAAIQKRQARKQWPHAHALDMQTLGELRRQRAALQHLQGSMTTIESEADQARGELPSMRNTSEAALTEAETGRSEAEAARKQLEHPTHEQPKETKLAITMSPTAETQWKSAETRAQFAEVRAHSAEVRAHAAESRLVAIENSAFWLLTAPARRMINSLPWLRRIGHRVIRSRVIRRWRGRLRNSSVTSVSSTGRARSIFDPLGALKAEPLPESARRSIIVPFNVAPAAPPRIAVMVHAFYPERLQEIIERAEQIPDLPDIFLTTDNEEKRTEIEAQLVGRKLGRIEIRVFPNRGRDIAPKLFGLADVYAHYDLILHLHTKKSLHSSEGNVWFEYLLRTLVGDESVIRSVLAAFAVQPKLGLVFADHWAPMRSWINWGHDYLIARQLATRMGFQLSRDEPLEFPAGSMFWARPAALEPLLRLKLDAADFSEEMGQVDGTTAHAIERLFLRVCERAGYSWARIAHAELFHGNEASAFRVRSREELEMALRHHAVLFADPALRASVRVLPDRPETWPIRMIPEFDDRPRINLLLPTFRSSSLFGGIATAHTLFERIADVLGAGFERRMILTTEDRPIAPSDLPAGWSIVDPMNGGDRGVVQLLRGSRSVQGLPVRPHDVFFASAWWDAAAAYGLIDLQRSFFRCGARLRYFIQDYEPNFSAWSAPWALAEGTYHRPGDTVALVNSQFLADYLDQLNLHFADRYVFQPLWTEGLGRPGSDPVERENLIVVYWRPHVERNLGPIVASALAHWLEADPYAAQDWRIVGVGEDSSDAQLAKWGSMTSLGKLTLGQYRDLLRRAKVGLALMLSPHPSYPPLEMAAFGLRVVVNGFGPKNLSRFGDAFETVSDLSPHAIAASLRRTTSAWANGAGPTFDQSAVFASEPALAKLAFSVADGIRAEVDTGHRSGHPE